MSGELELLPDTRQVRDFYCHARQSVTQRWGDHSFEAEFDRWLAGHEAEVAAKALEDAARAFDGDTISLDVFSNEVEKSYWRVANEQRSILVDSLRARAAEYRKAVQSDA